MRTVTRTATGFQADLGRWRLAGGEPLVRAKQLPVARPGLGIDVGNPHVVVALADDAELDGLDLAYQPILEPEPAAGANIEFVVPAEPLVEDGVGRIRMRVHERGSGETLSCGTGRRGFGARGSALGGGGAHRTSGACRFREVCSACACSRPTTVSTWRSPVRPSSSSTAC